MFESVLQRGTEPPVRLGTRAALSLAAHAGVLAVLVWLGASKSAADVTAPEVMFFNPNGTGAAGKPALAQGNPEAVPKPATTTARKRDPQTFSRNAKAAATSTAKAAEDDPYGSPDGDPNGSPLGDPNGTPGAGSPTGTVTAAPPAPEPTTPPAPKNVVIPFGPGMDRPQKLSGPDPTYTREAREAKVEGKLLVQCVVTTDGTLGGCTVLKSLPFMDQAVLSALSKQRWSPAKVGGQPVTVTYTIPFSFKLKD